MEISWGSLHLLPCLCGCNVLQSLSFVTWDQVCFYTEVQSCNSLYSARFLSIPWKKNKRKHKAVKSTDTQGVPDRHSAFTGVASFTFFRCAGAYLLEKSFVFNSRKDLLCFKSHLNSIMEVKIKWFHVLGDKQWEKSKPGSETIFLGAFNILWFKECEL